MTLLRRLSTVTVCAVGGVFALGTFGAASAYADCQHPVGAADTYVCTDTTTTQPVPIVGGQEVVVGGYTVGGSPVGTPPVSTPPVGPNATPAVPVTSPTRICFFVDCVESGETLATVPSQPIFVGPVNVFPALSVPVPVVTVPVVARQILPGTVPVPAITVESTLPAVVWNEVANLENQYVYPTLATVEWTVNRVIDYTCQRLDPYLYCY